MKRFFLSFLIVFCFITLSGCSDDDTYITTSAIIFTRPECPRSRLAIQYFNELKQKNNLITYEIRDLSIAENRVLVKKFRRKHHITAQQIYTPIIFTPKGFSSGWDERTPEELKLLLNIR